MYSRTIPELLGGEGEKTLRGHARADAERVRIANFVAPNHVTKFGWTKRATIDDGLIRLAFSDEFNRARQKEPGVFVGESGRGEEVAERDQFATSCQLISCFFAQLA